MDFWLLTHEWSDFAIRWLHVITAIAWIGSSFYFVHLDLSLQNHGALPEGAGGDAWQVHGGGFYHMIKYFVAPPHMPEDLTWFKWESYATFLSGFALLIVHYYANPDLYLIDKTVLALTNVQAIGISLACLVAGWLVYDGLCRSKLDARDSVLLAVFFAMLVIAEYGLTLVFGGRGAFLQLGAIMGTVMSANVAMVIIPNQKKVVASLLAGEKPDPMLGKIAKQRSLHNNYLTLPVLFLMLSHHYPLAFATRYNFIIAGLVLIMGGVIRHFFNARHARKPTPWWTWAVASVCALTIVALSWFGSYGSYAQTGAVDAASKPIAFAQVEAVVTARCSMCHAKAPVWDSIGSPPQGVMLDTPTQTQLHKHDIALQAVYTHAMPPGGNLTEISDDERAVLAHWVARSEP